MELFTAEKLIEILEEIGEDFGYKVDNDTDYDIEDTATISYLGDNDKLFLSVVVLYGGIYTKINIFDQNDQNIFSKSVRAANFDKNEYQDVINKVQEELKKNLAHVPKKIETNDLYKVKNTWHDKLDKTINEMAQNGWELYHSMASESKYDNNSGYIKVLEYNLVFRRKEK